MTTTADSIKGRELVVRELIFIAKKASTSNRMRLSRMSDAMNILSPESDIGLWNDIIEIFLACEWKLDKQQERDLRHKIALLRHNIAHATERRDIYDKYIVPVMEYGWDMCQNE